MKKILTFFFAALVLSVPSAFACSVCFGDPNSDMSKGVTAAVILLLSVITGVLIALGVIIVRWSRRAKKLYPTLEETV